MGSSKKPSKPRKVLPPKTELMEFKKNNEAISVLVTEGNLTMMGRKVFNVMVHAAQLAGAPGTNAPLDTEAAKKYFWIRMAEVARNTCYDSNDTARLKETTEELSNIRIQMEDHKQWTSERLLAGVKIYNPAGLKSRGGEVWFGYAFPPEVHDHVMRPNTYTTLSLFYQQLFSGSASLGLYEECRKFATNPGGVTARKPWRWWYHIMTGNPVSTDPPEFKYFKRDTVKPAVKEVNDLTDIDIELIEHRVGRKVIDFQFRVRIKPQQVMDFSQPPVINSAIIERIAALGLSAREASDLSCLHDEGLLKATLDLVERRLKSKTGPEVESPAAYFRTALKKQFATPEAVAKQSMPPAKPATPPPGEDPLTKAFLADRRRRASEYFKELGDVEQTQLAERFQQVAPAHLQKQLRTFGLEPQTIWHPFINWLAQDLWGEPTDKDLLEFARATTIEGEARRVAEATA